jgi:trehalose-phosphatase
MGIVSFGVTQEDEQLLEEARALSWRVLKTVPEAALAHSESKTGCEAIHWRPLAAPERAVVAEVARKLWSPLLGEGKAQIDLFDGGIEFSITGRTKGEAVRHLLEAWDWEAHPAAFLGDDLTDENGFRELLGKGLPVLVRNEPRETLAPLRLRLPEGVLDFLQRWEAAL